MLWRRILFGRYVGYAGVFTAPGLTVFFLREYFQNRLWAALSHLWEQSLGMGPLSMTQGMLAAIAAGIIGAVFLGLFRLGEWWGTKRRPEFFVDRFALEKVHEARPLQQVETAECVWLSGQKELRSAENLNKIKKLILPNPNSVSLKHFADTVPGSSPVQEDIEGAISFSQNQRINVRLYPEFIGHSWWIGNRGQPTAFVHIECVLPYSMTERRPSFRVYRWQDEKLYEQYCAIFDSMWDASKPPEQARDSANRGQSRINSATQRAVGLPDG